MYKQIKIFDIPADIKKAYREIFSYHFGVSIPNYFRWIVKNPVYYANNYTNIVMENIIKMDNWFLRNDVKELESILIYTQ
jgi:hypothetical protein